MIGLCDFLRVQVCSAELQNSNVHYCMKVQDTNGKTEWHVFRRYSQFRMLEERVSKLLTQIYRQENFLFPYPKDQILEKQKFCASYVFPKRWFVFSKSPIIVHKRIQLLNHYINRLLDFLYHFHHYYDENKFKKRPSFLFKSTQLIFNLYEIVAHFLQVPQRLDKLSNKATEDTYFMELQKKEKHQQNRKKQELQFRPSLQQERKSGQHEIWMKMISDAASYNRYQQRQSMISNQACSSSSSRNTLSSIESTSMEHSKGKEFIQNYHNHCENMFSSFRNSECYDRQSI